MVWVSLFALLILVLSFVSGLKEGAVKQFFSLVVLIIATIFGAVHTPMALLSLPVGLLSGLMFASIALTFTSIAPAISTFNYFFTLFITPMFFFSGVFFPLSSFPQVVQNLSWIIPLAPVVHLTRSLVSGDVHFGLLWAFGLIILYAAGFFSISLVTMRRRLAV